MLQHLDLFVAVLGVWKHRRAVFRTKVAILNVPNSVILGNSWGSDWEKSSGGQHPAQHPQTSRASIEEKQPTICGLGFFFVVWGGFF